VLKPGTLILLLCPVVALAADPTRRVLDPREYHLGTPGFPEWAEFEGRTPHGRRLDLKFQAEPGDARFTLLFNQRDVKHSWQVQINGRRIGNLVTVETPLVHALNVPPGLLRDGENTLSIVPPTATDDILVGPFRLDPRPIQEVLGESALDVVITDASTGAGIPARVTITDESDCLAALLPAPTNSTEFTTRPGVAYVREGTARLNLPAGRYLVHASRGFEWSVKALRISVPPGQSRRIPLALRREVPTPGWVAADTHIHTLTHSGHGDATIDERMLTIAGEGIELAVATDHNHHADYSEAAARTRLRSHFTPVIGNEVTTKHGHFNAFPIQSGARVPDFKLEKWGDLLAGIRATPGVKVIALNHPRDLHSGFTPLGPTNFNALTGAPLRAAAFQFDALEVVTSAAMQSDAMLLFRDWFALLNHGHRLTALGASDTHDVSRFILGQARTYIACDDRDPARLDIATACTNLLKGRALVSFGLLAHIRVEDRFTAGDLATNLPPQIQVDVTVLGPSWTSADRLELFANGLKLASREIRKAEGPVNARMTFSLQRPMNDSHLVAIASGPGITAPYWETPRPYQPSSRVFTPRVLAATNPVWLDADGDGRFTSPHALASKLIKQHGTEPAKLLPELARLDEAVALQAASLCHGAGVQLEMPAFRAALTNAPPAVRRGFEAFVANLR